MNPENCQPISYYSCEIKTDFLGEKMAYDLKGNLQIYNKEVVGRYSLRNFTFIR